MHRRFFVSIKLEKLPIVDKDGMLKGLITIKDIEKAVRYPSSARDENGRLLAGAAIGVTADVLDRVEALNSANVDVVVLDSAHRAFAEYYQYIEKGSRGVSCICRLLLEMSQRRRRRLR